jgi:hypothetical protein
MMLVKLLRAFQSTFLPKSENASDEADEAEKVWDAKVQQVEVVLPQGLMTVYFPEPDVMKFVPKQLKRKIEATVEVSNDQSKVEEFVEMCNDILPQVLHSQNLSRWGFFRFFLDNDSKQLFYMEQAAVWQSAIIVLVLIMTDPRDLKRGGLDIDGNESVSAQATNVQSFVLLVNQSFLLLVHLAVQVPIASHTTGTSDDLCPRLDWLPVIFALLLVGGVMSLLFLQYYLALLIVLAFFVFLKLWTVLPERFVPRVARTLMMVTAQDPVWVPIAFLTLNILSLNVPVLYSFLPLVIIFRDDGMRSVVQAVTVPIVPLAQMFFLMIIIVSIFAMVNYLEADYIVYYDAQNNFLGTEWKDLKDSFYMEDDDGNFIKDECATQRICWMYTFYRGTTYGDGIGDFMGRDYDVSFIRWTIDVLFFIIYTIVVFNMVAGIIIDTFGSLRDDKMFRKDKLDNYVFISGLNRSELDHAAVQLGDMDLGFDHYRKKRQNTWAYMAWIFHLNMKQREKMTGPEQYCIEMLEKNTTCWIPVGRAVTIEQAEHHDKKGDPTEDVKKIKEDVKSLASQVVDVFGVMKDKFATVEEALAELRRSGRRQTTRP